MGKMVKIRINGRDYKVPEGVNLIDAAEGVGIHIPNFCYLKGMKGIGACRMCMVEVGGRMSVACIMRTKEGMDVVTENEKIRELRKFVVDMILSMHPLDCMTCTKAGVCGLQKYAYEFEVRESTFTRKKFGFPVDDGNPFIKRDPDYCILCGRCVRVCKEQGTNVLDFYGRGVGSRVIAGNDSPLHEAGCTFCGSCIDACPVNAILEADRWRKGREWEYERFNSVCLSCGNACSTLVSVHGKDVAKVTIGAEEGRAEHYICAYGRYGFDSMISETRVSTPMKRIDGELKPVTWEEAYSSAAEALSNPAEVGIVTTGNLPNEDLLMLKGLAEAAGIRNIDSTVSLYADPPSLIGDEVDLEEADLVMVVGLDPSQRERVLPALDATLRKMAARKTTKLVVVSAGDTGLSEVAELTLKGDEAATLAGVARALLRKGLKAPEGLEIPDVELTEDVEKAAELFAGAKSPVLVTSPPLFEAARNIALMKGAALSVPVEANAKGTLMMGVIGDGKGYTEMTGGGTKVLYAVGEVPVSRPDGVGFLIVQHSHLTDLAKEADLVLPATTPYETEGTVVDYMGRLKRLERAVQPYEDAKPHREIFGGVAKGMDLSLKPPKTTDVKKVIKTFKVEAGPSAFEKRGDLAFNPEELIPALNTTVINGSRLFWLKEVEEAAAV